MSAGEWLHASLMAHLAENAALDPLSVFDMPPARAALPYAVIDDPVLTQADASGLTGRQGTVAIRCFDAGERPGRLRLLIGRLEEQVTGMPADLGGEGWRLGLIRLQRSRLQRAPERRWAGMSEFAVRIYRANA